MEHAGYMQLTEEEVSRLRNYLACGGALLVNDFWGRQEWDGFDREMRRVLPHHSWMQLSTNHALFRCVFDVGVPMHRMRVPTMQLWNEAFDPGDPWSQPHRVYRGDGSEEMTVRALCDEAGRIMVLAIHNSDISDGWEREGENDKYFERFSERIAYPVGINVIMYFMTH
jgi:hypothetical protein